MERLTERYRNKDNTGISKGSLIDRPGKGYPSGHALQIVTKLANYEDVEEQGLLLRLPCVYNTTVFVIPTQENGMKSIAEMELLGYSIGEPSNNANLFSKNRFNKDVPKMYQPSIDDFGKTWFLTRAEAEQALAEKVS